MIEKVEELRAEVQAHVSPWQGKLFYDGEVAVDKIRTYGRDARRIPQLTDRRRNKAGRVDPLELAVVGVVSVAISNLSRAVPVIAVAAVLKEGPRLVIAVDQGHGKSRRDSLDESHLEVAKKSVGHTTPITAELLTPAEGQIVDEAGGETIVEVDLR